jgi:ferredoxin
MPKCKITIDKETCIGCGTCVALVPELFVMGKDGKAEIIGGKTIDDLQCLETENPKAKEAAEACPVSAIKVEEIK